MQMVQCCSQAVDYAFELQAMLAEIEQQAEVAGFVETVFRPR